MKRAHLAAIIAAFCLVALAVSGLGTARALTTRASRAAEAGTPMLGTAPRTWHVIAGFNQHLPAGNDNAEAVNQFYPRTLTIYPGDKVTWTVNDIHEVHTVTFAPDPVLRKMEDPQRQAAPRMINGQQVFVLNPAVWFPSARGPLVETDSGTATTLLNCGQIGPAGVPEAPQSCTITFPNVGTYAYDCLLHSGIPGLPDMDGVIKVVPRPKPANHMWTVWAGTGSSTDANDGFFPPSLTIQVGDSVTWKSGGVHFHTVSFGIDPRKVVPFVAVGKTTNGPILALNPLLVNPIVPEGGIYTGGKASSGILGLGGNYMNLPGQVFLAKPFTLTFTKPGVYRYYCLVHAPLMVGTITVVPATAGQ
jgi:plastocyanin